MSGRRRPIFVWIIFLGYTFVSLANIALLFLLTSGLYPLAPEQRALLAGMSVFDRVVGYLLAAMLIVGAFLLFRLKKSAVPVLCVTLFLDFASKLVTFMNYDLSGYVALAGLLGPLAGSLVLAGVCLYARSLKKRGILA